MLHVCHTHPACPACSAQLLLQPLQMLQEPRQMLQVPLQTLLVPHAVLHEPHSDACAGSAQTLPITPLTDCVTGCGASSAPATA